MPPRSNGNFIILVVCSSTLAAATRKVVENVTIGLWFELASSGFSVWSLHALSVPVALSTTVQRYAL